jgi:DNA-binding beta-propeller fold protein YncE
VAEGADVPLSRTVPAVSSRSSPDVCVAAVLGDALRRVAVLGGREGMPRSLGSVYGGAVTRFLGGSLRGVESRVIDTPRVKSLCSGMAVSRDGTTLLVSNWNVGATLLNAGDHAIHEFRVSDGSRLRVVGGFGAGPLQFNLPHQLWIACDDHVFVADYRNNRVQVLTPTLDFHSFVGARQLRGPDGVCADGAVVVVSEYDAHRIGVFNRRDGALLRRFGTFGRGDGQLCEPFGVCFMSGHHHIAVADYNNNRVSVFSVDGEFIRHVGVGVLSHPHSVACSAFDELVVADYGNNLPAGVARTAFHTDVACRDSSHIAAFSGSGELLMTMGAGCFTGVALHGGTVFAVDERKAKCVVFR